MKRWYELADNTLVRDSRGDLRMVHHERGMVWLWHWSDEYGAWYSQDGGDTAPRVHNVGEEIDEMVTVMQAVPTPAP